MQLKHQSYHLRKAVVTSQYTGVPLPWEVTFKLQCQCVVRDDMTVVGAVGVIAMGTITYYHTFTGLRSDVLYMVKVIASNCHQTYDLTI